MQQEELFPVSIQDRGTHCSLKRIVKTFARISLHLNIKWPPSIIMIIIGPITAVLKLLFKCQLETWLPHWPVTVWLPLSVVMMLFCLAAHITDCPAETDNPLSWLRVQSCLVWLVSAWPDKTPHHTCHSWEMFSPVWSTAVLQARHGHGCILYILPKNQSLPFSLTWMMDVYTSPKSISFPYSLPEE